MTEQEFRDRLVAHMAKTEERLEHIEAAISALQMGTSKMATTGISTIVAGVIVGLSETIRALTGNK